MGGPPLKSMNNSFDISTLTVHQTHRNQCNIYSYHSLSYHGTRNKTPTLHAFSRLICYACFAFSFPTVTPSHPSQNVITAATVLAQKVQNMCDELVSVDPPLRADSFLATRPRARVQLALRHPLHEANVIVLGEVSVFLQVGAFVLRHTGEKVLD